MRVFLRRAMEGRVHKSIFGCLSIFCHRLVFSPPVSYYFYSFLPLSILGAFLVGVRFLFPFYIGYSFFSYPAWWFGVAYWMGFSSSSSSISSSSSSSPHLLSLFVS